MPTPTPTPAFLGTQLPFLLWGDLQTTEKQLSLVSVSLGTECPKSQQSPRGPAETKNPWAH